MQPPSLGRPPPPPPPVDDLTHTHTLTLALNTHAHKYFPNKSNSAARTTWLNIAACLAARVGVMGLQCNAGVLLCDSPTNKQHPQRMAGKLNWR